MAPPPAVNCKTPFLPDLHGIAGYWIVFTQFGIPGIGLRTSGSYNWASTEVGWNRK